MEYFTDSKGRGWSLELNVRQIQKVRAATKTDEEPGGINLLDIANEATLSRLLGDPITFVDVLWILCEDQADVTDEEFGEGFAGDVIYNASEALVCEIVNFTPNPNQRKALAELWEKIKETDEKASDLVRAEIAAIDPETEAQKSYGKSTSSQESSE